MRIEIYMIFYDLFQDIDLGNIKLVKAVQM